jgi:hypothetical protein
VDIYVSLVYDNKNSILVHLIVQLNDCTVVNTYEGLANEPSLAKDVSRRTMFIADNHQPDN